MLHIFAAPFRPKSKGVIDRCLRSFKEYFKESFSGLEGKILPFSLPLRKILALVLGIGILWYFSRSYNGGIQPGIDLKSPKARIKEKVSLSDPEIFKELAKHI